MARHITAKKQLTRERALALIDQRISQYKSVIDSQNEVGYDTTGLKHGVTALEGMRGEIVWACEHGVFPPSK